MVSLHALDLTGPGDNHADIVLFIGSAFAFPEVTLRLVRIEFGGLGAERIDRLDPEAALPEGVTPRLVIVEDRLADALVAHHDALRRKLGDVPIALAYACPVTARRLLALQQTAGRLEELRFLPLNAPIAGWVSMLRLLLAREFVLPGELVSPPPALPVDAGAASMAGAVTLTRRELEVLGQVSQGHRNKIIADALGLSEHTVKLHIHNIITKIGVDNRTAAANWYLAQGGTGQRPRPMP